MLIPNIYPLPLNPRVTYNVPLATHKHSILLHLKYCITVLTQYFITTHLLLVQRRHQFGGVAQSAGVATELGAFLGGGDLTAEALLFALGAHPLYVLVLHLSSCEKRRIFEGKKRRKGTKKRKEKDVSSLLLKERRRILCTWSTPTLCPGAPSLALRDKK